MYRPRSNDVWLNIPGVVAAYQPVAAPGPLLARYNQANGGSNLYRATDGVAPTWSPLTGWTLNGSSQYLGTGIIPLASPGSILVAFSDGSTGVDNYTILGALDWSGKFSLIQVTNTGASMGSYNGGSGAAFNNPILATGVYGVSNKTAYRNGVAEGNAIPAGTGMPAYEYYIGALNIAGAAGQFWSGKIKAALIAGTPLSASEMWHASRQMAYCHVNPEWSAWGRRRRYYYAPSAAGGFQAAWAARQNRLIGGGADRV